MSFKDLKELTTKDEYDKFIKSPDNKDKLIVIDFFAEWCGPCKQMKPKIAKFSDKYTDVVFVKVDCDEAEPVAESENVEVMPAFLFYKNGDKLHVICGTNDKDLEDKIKELK
ncbi:hypothetical protein OS493_008647 [Desmophyllum pertusum]|uniref:Thioredoxin n=1 Tax=Desmophyllum pertusum TaxID=174260 RepID=A0A9W9ZRF5_9CNID|nr:hypothetical protein OS493_008647 [Desmophyllum pertusum]